MNGVNGLSKWFIYQRVVYSMAYLQRFNTAHNDQLAAISRLFSCETLEDYQEVVETLTLNKYKQTFYKHAEIVKIFKSAPLLSQKVMIAEALPMAKLSDDDVILLLSDYEDANGMPYEESNIGNIPVEKLLPMIVNALIECSKVKVNDYLITREELDILGEHTVGVMDEASGILAQNPEIETGKLLSLSIKNVLMKIKHKIRGAKNGN